MEEVEGVERDAKQVDERVVPAGHQEKRYHVDNGEVAGPVSHERRNLLVRARVVDGHDAKGYIGGEVAEQKDELEARRQGADIEGRAELELAVVPLAEDGCVEHVPLEPRELLGRLRKESLRVVVQTRHGPDVPDQERREPPGSKRGRDDAENEEQVVREHPVHDPGIQAGSAALACLAARSRSLWARHDDHYVVLNLNTREGSFPT